MNSSHHLWNLNINPDLNQIPNLNPLIALIFLCSTLLYGQTDTAKGTDVSAPLHLLKPGYTMPYKSPTVNDITNILYRVYTYLDKASPAKMINLKTGNEVTDFKIYNPDVTFAKGDFRLLSYEWGVTYAGMLHAGEVTGDERFTNYTTQRMKFISDLYPYYKKYSEKEMGLNTPLKSVADPHMLDDAGSICAAMIKTNMKDGNKNLLSMINNLIDFISHKEYRLEDGTFARNGPYPNTLWLDDLFMSVPALAQMGRMTGEQKYFDDAAKQIIQFSKRMFNSQKGIYMHGWVESMQVHPEFHWARANGWAILATIELLDVLPEEHPLRNEILNILKNHINGLIRYQSGEGFWHQLLDRYDSYLETSATAIYTYCITRAINKKYIDARIYGATAVLGWNALTTRINDSGQVEGTCVGTGMGFDPAFYYYRPTSKFAAHGYGPTILAGAEMILLLKNYKVVYDGMSVQVYE